MHPQDFFTQLQNQGISFFAGVPDSLLKDICAYITDHAPLHQHVICANEGGAVALGIGYHLATKKIPLIYLQNSGLGNMINPLLSLADEEVYSIPLLLMIGWRGEPGFKDEPQHVKQGRVMLKMLDAMEIPYSILDTDLEKSAAILTHAICDARQHHRPHALVVRKNTFAEYKLSKDLKVSLELSREEAIKQVVNALNERDVVVATTGMTSRELFEHRKGQNNKQMSDFLTVGGMGHALKVALGIALQNTKREVFCIDGDGAAIMHLGALAIIGTLACGNFKHVLINNGAHDSVGGQPTAGFDIDFQKIAMAAGYKNAMSVATLEELTGAMDTLKKNQGPQFLEIKVRKGARKDLGRPTLTPLENKQLFMNFLQNS